MKIKPWKVKQALAWVALVIAVLMTSSCATKITAYEATQPEMKLEEFFDGELYAYGIVQNRFGQVQKRFTVDMLAYWEGNVGILEEDFFYADGTTDRRVWRLVKEGEGVYTGTASDVSKDAAGLTKGFAFQWGYQLEVPIDGKVWTFTLNDWMYLVDEKRLVNRAEMKKFGLVVGEITLVIEKQ